MNDLDRLRVWLCDQRDKQMLNALAKAINVDRRTIQRIINQPDYHPRFDTFQLLKDEMEMRSRQTETAKAPADRAAASDDTQPPAGTSSDELEDTTSGPHGTIITHFDR